MRVAIAAVLLCSTALCGVVTAGEGRVVRDSVCGVEVTLPDAGWALRDQSGSGAIVHVYSPSASLVPRFCAIREPRAFASEGLATRAKQIAQLGAGRVEVVDATIAGAPAQKIDYVVKGYRSVEYGLQRGDEFLIVQVVAAQSEWDDEAGARTLQAIFDSVRLVAAAEPVLRIDSATPEQVRTARRALEPPRDFAIRRHDVEVGLDPAGRRLVCRDAFEVEALAPEVRALRLRCVGVVVDTVRMAGENLVVEQPGDGTLRVALPSALRRGQTVELDFAAHADDFHLATDQKLIEEISVLAQAREASTFSSHALYYPIDDENDASVLLRITVPESHRAVSGGAEPWPPAAGPGTRTYAWRFDARPRLLPPGFAVARYESCSAATRSGLLVEIHHFAGEEAAAGERLAIALRAATLFEELMGPLPWRRVAYCHVRPDSKETGVSLPGLVLLSDGFFRPDADVPLQGEGFVAGAQDGALVMADELGHQWNGYAAPYPNELAEGLSTYMCLLFLEREAGAGEYAKAVRDCADAYIAAAETGTDVAVANPALYRSPCYRVVSFAKVAAILDHLRRRLGDKAFFSGWRAAFASAPSGRRLDYDDLRRAFEKASGRELAAFFDAWFFRPGHPRVRSRWEAAETDGRPAVRLSVAQVQPGEPFAFALDVAVRTSAGDVTRTLDVDAREESVVWELPAPPLSVELDPQHRMPLMRQVAPR